MTNCLRELGYVLVSAAESGIRTPPYSASPEIAATSDALTDQSPYVVRTAGDAAASLAIVEARDGLLALLADPSSYTRSTAVRALRSLWRHSDYDVILELFRSDPSEDVRKESAWALRSHTSEAHWLELFALWSDADLPRYRTWACELAEEFGSAQHRPRLEHLSRDQNGHVRKAAESTLLRINC